MPFRIALSGLNAASTGLKVAANNIANVSTTGFKGSRTESAEVFATGTQSVSSNASGSGVHTSRISQQLTQGNVDFTNNALDVAIGGDGFFVLSDNGTRVYTRASSFSVDANGNVVNAQGHRLQAYPTGGNGQFNTGAPTDLRLTTGANPPTATTSASIDLNLPANAPVPQNPVFDPLDPSSFNHTASLTIYDTLGSAHTANLYFVKDPAANIWTARVQVDGTNVGGATPIEFGSSGTLQVPAGGQMPLPPYTPTTGAADINLTLNFQNTTEFGNSFGVNSLSQDGFTTGRLTGVSVDPTGIVAARFTNGQSTQLGKLAIANFANPQGLQQIGNTAWGESSASGDAILGEAGTASFGSIQSGALEASNVDLTEQLVNMIELSRQYELQINTIRTAKENAETLAELSSES